TSAPDNSWLAVAAGIVGHEVRIWISCNNPTATQKRQAVRSLLQDHQVELQRRNPRWTMFAPDAPGLVDAEITKPLTSVLAVENWQSPLIDFVRHAVSDLNEVGILPALVETGAE